MLAKLHHSDNNVLQCVRNALSFRHPSPNTVPKQENSQNNALGGEQGVISDSLFLLCLLHFLSFSSDRKKQVKAVEKGEGGDVMNEWVIHHFLYSFNVTATVK